MFQWSKRKEKERTCDHLIRQQNLTPFHLKSTEDNKYVKNRHQPDEWSLKIAYDQHDNLVMLASLQLIIFTSIF